jgi:hypothetical protein
MYILIISVKLVVRQTYTSRGACCEMDVSCTDYIMLLTFFGHKYGVGIHVCLCYGLTEYLVSPCSEWQTRMQLNDWWYVYAVKCSRTKIDNFSFAVFEGGYIYHETK